MATSPHAADQFRGLPQARGSSPDTDYEPSRSPSTDENNERQGLPDHKAQRASIPKLQLKKPGTGLLHEPELPRTPREQLDMMADSFNASLEQLERSECAAKAAREKMSQNATVWKALCRKAVDEAEGWQLQARELLILSLLLLPTLLSVPLLLPSYWSLQAREADLEALAMQDKAASAASQVQRLNALCTQAVEEAQEWRLQALDGDVELQEQRERSGAAISVCQQAVLEAEESRRELRLRDEEADNLRNQNRRIEDEKLQATALCGLAVAEAEAWELEAIQADAEASAANVRTVQVTALCGLAVAEAEAWELEAIQADAAASAANVRTVQARVLRETVVCQRDAVQMDAEAAGTELQQSRSSASVDGEAADEIMNLHEQAAAALADVAAISAEAVVAAYAWLGQLSQCDSEAALRGGTAVCKGVWASAACQAAAQEATHWRAHAIELAAKAHRHNEAEWGSNVDLRDLLSRRKHAIDRVRAQLRELSLRKQAKKLLFEFKMESITSTQVVEHPMEPQPLVKDTLVQEMYVAQTADLSENPREESQTVARMEERFFHTEKRRTIYACERCRKFTGAYDVVIAHEEVCAVASAIGQTLEEGGQSAECVVQ